MKQIIQKDARTGIEYVYEGGAYWDKEKKQSRYGPRRLIGHIDPATGEVVPNRPMRASASSPSSRRVFIGSSHLFDQIAASIALDTDLAAAFPGTDAAMLSIAYYMLSEGSSTMARFARWSRTHAHPLADELTSQRISELLAKVTEDGLKAFFRSRIARCGDRYWFFDTTSISSYSQFIESVRWGKNKDGMALPQINLALVSDADSMLPVYFKNVAGNISDVVLVRTLIEDVKALGATKLRLCMDRGFYSKANIDSLISAHMKFLIGLKTSYGYVRQAIEKNAEELKSWQNYDEEAHVWGLRIPYGWDHEERAARTELIRHAARRTYIHLFYSPARVVKDEEELAQLLRRLSSELASSNRQEEHEALYTRYFKRVRSGRYAVRGDAVDAERANFGYFALLTNDASLTAKDSLAVYRGKDAIEKSFADIKDRLDFKTPKVENTETLAGKLLVTFVALIMATELRRKMREAGLNSRYTMQGLIDELDSIERYESEGKRPRVLHVTDKQKKIYQAMGVNPPNVS
jgi:transposase